MTFALKFLAVLVLVTVVDFLWAQYIKYTASSHALKSASYATAIYLLGCMITIAYVNDHMMIIPAAIGSFVGTYLSAKIKMK